MQIRERLDCRAWKSEVQAQMFSPRTLHFASRHKLYISNSNVQADLYHIGNAGFFSSEFTEFELYRGKNPFTCL